VAAYSVATGRSSVEGVGLDSTELRTLGRYPCLASGCLWDELEQRERVVEPTAFFPTQTTS
jgi:hypothetical protein